MGMAGSDGEALALELGGDEDVDLLEVVSGQGGGSTATVELVLELAPLAAEETASAAADFAAVIAAAEA